MPIEQKVPTEADIPRLINMILALQNQRNDALNRLSDVEAVNMLLNRRIEELQAKS